MGKQTISRKETYVSNTPGLANGDELLLGQLHAHLDGIRLQARVVEDVVGRRVGDAVLA